VADWTGGRPPVGARPTQDLAYLDAMPDDGNRYELVDGQLIVTPAPGADHQDYVGGILALL
jgi:Uma2 family endonuclease